ncbi:MAG: hypothetical protein KDI68_09930 [Gammaproteobacteria bacterium]|nr:hypothetical protein [Gammaproteobacteria bacterium]
MKERRQTIGWKAWNRRSRKGVSEPVEKKMLPDNDYSSQSLRRRQERTGC